MADIHTKEVRSYNMSRIRSKNTRPEILLRKLLFNMGLRYRLHVMSLPGKPDIVLKKYKTVIFVHGCFWHGHENCKYFVIPKTRTEWWLKKIEKNKNKDIENEFQLFEKNWKVITVFECQLKKENLTKSLNEIIAKLY